MPASSARQRSLPTWWPGAELKLDHEHAGELGAPASPADLVTKLELGHEHAGKLGSPASPPTW